MDTIANINQNVEDILTRLSDLDVNVDNTSVTDALGNILTALTNLDVSTTPIVDPSEFIYEGYTLAASSDATSIPIDVSLVKKLWIFCTSTTSTNLTVLIYGQSGFGATDGVVIQPFTLSNTSQNGACYITDCPPYIKVKIINNDAVNAAIVTVKIVKTR